MTPPIRDLLSTTPSYEDISFAWRPTVTPSLNFTELTDNITNNDWLTSTALSAAVLSVILSALFGNCLVVAGVYRFRRLRTMANSFLVSLAVADFLVALLVMPFSAVNLVAGRWPFGRVVCDLFNANDVLFSTASLLHLCCVAVDRYVAVTDPFGYDRKMSRRRVSFMLAGVWTASALVSHVPIHLGWYSPSLEPAAQSLQHNATSEPDALATESSTGVYAASGLSAPDRGWASTDSSATTVSDLLEKPGECSFEVNRIYAFVSSGVSFWVPATVMLFAYVKIFREAQRQERRIRALRSTMPISTPSITAQQTTTSTSTAAAVTDCRRSTLMISTSAVQNAPATAMGACRMIQRHSDGAGGPASLLPNSYARRLSRRLQTDNKAARTLGIIMGAFIVCWLPFFTWYIVSTLCGRTIDGDGGQLHGLCVVITRPEVVSTLFWVGYANSALNPFIYAAFNREFRKAFHLLLTSMIHTVCCPCLRRNRYPLDRVQPNAALNSDAAFVSMVYNEQAIAGDNSQ